MNKYFKLIIVIILILIGFMFFKNDNEYLDHNLIESKLENKVESSMLSIMLETGEETGQYVQAYSTEWQDEEYEFNPNLSKCENGSKLEWNAENKSVVLKTTTSDKCYVYFDKKTSKPLEIESVEVDDKSTYNTVKLTVKATGGTGKYSYSIVENSCTQCDETMAKCGLNSTNPNILVTDNIITISNLVSSTASYIHTFVVKVADGQNEKTYTVSNIEAPDKCPYCPVYLCPISPEPSPGGVT